MLSPIRSDRKGKSRAPGNNVDDVGGKVPAKRAKSGKGDFAVSVYMWLNRSLMTKSSEAAAARKELAALEKAKQMQEKQMEKARLKVRVLHAWADSQAEKEAEKSQAKKLADVNKVSAYFDRADI